MLLVLDLIYGHSVSLTEVAQKGFLGFSSCAEGALYNPNAGLQEEMALYRGYFFLLLSF